MAPLCHDATTPDHEALSDDLDETTRSEHLRIVPETEVSPPADYFKAPSRKEVLRFASLGGISRSATATLGIAHVGPLVAGGPPVCRCLLSCFMACSRTSGQAWTNRRDEIAELDTVDQ